MLFSVGALAQSFDISDKKLFYYSVAAHGTGTYI